VVAGPCVIGQSKVKGGGKELTAACVLWNPVFLGQWSLFLRTEAVEGR